MYVHASIKSENYVWFEKHCGKKLYQHIKGYMHIPYWTQHLEKKIGGRHTASIKCW